MEVDPLTASDGTEQSALAFRPSAMSEEIGLYGLPLECVPAHRPLYSLIDVLPQYGLGNNLYFSIGYKFLIGFFTTTAWNLGLSWLLE